ncbi:hypothetical protein J2X65_002052 [Ancylobacter sp. 3268]|uniref:hypothetical protein n=1 Tax=Ancylobacter sp. 3268 TaxID=2817752 RepID=UPI002866A716|nr:hypothetical protein [Ancylobacter sp. 3268]MDR6952693.1 hypothetical protein [Ancylobacter sp. 3268]
MAKRTYSLGPSDPGVVHQQLLPVVAWPAGDKVSLVRKASGGYEQRWRYLVFETAGTVLIEDEAGKILPYTREAGAVLPFSGRAIVKSYAHGIAGQPTDTTPALVLYGHA